MRLPALRIAFRLFQALSCQDCIDALSECPGTCGWSHWMTVDGATGRNYYIISEFIHNIFYMTLGGSAARALQKLV